MIRAADQFPVVLLTGARQVGKTTLLHHVSSGDRTYVTLDDQLVASLAKTDLPNAQIRAAHISVTADNPWPAALFLAGLTH